MLTIRNASTTLDFTLKINPPKTPNPYSNDFTMLAKFAQDNNLELIPRHPNQVQVDIDSPYLPMDFSQRLKMVNELSSIVRWGINTSRGGNIHITIDFVNELLPQETLLYEAILGSDFKRVALGAKGLKENNGTRFVSIFFEKPGTEVKYFKIENEKSIPA